MDRKNLGTFQEGRVRLFLVFNFILGAGTVVGFFSANSLLISHFGTSQLFQVYLGQGMLTIGFSALFYFLADRLPKSLFYRAWFLFLGALVLGSWALLQFSPPRIEVFLLVRSLFDSVAIASSLGYWLIVGDHFSQRGARKYYSKLMGAYIVGDMAGGLLLDGAATFVHSGNFVLLWGLLLAASPCFFAKIFRKIPRVVEDATLAQTKAKSPSGQPFPVFNRLALLLFAFWMLYSFFSDATDYLFNVAASQHWLTEDGLTAYYGKVAFFANAGILAYHALFSQRLLRRFGVDLAAAAIPGIIAGAWAFAYLQPSLTTLSLAQGLIYFFVDYLAITRLHIPLTVFSRASRGRVKAITEGLGRAFGFILLFFVARFFSFRPEFQELGRILLLAALGFLLFPFLFRAVYLRHLVRTLGSKDREIVSNAIRGLGERNKEAVAPILVRLFRRSKRRRVRRSIIRCFGHMRSLRGMRAVLAGYSECDRSVQETIIKVCRKWEGNPAPLGLWRKLT